MHAVVLLPGPSLKDLSAVPASDVTIGAKRAGTKFFCDHVAILDSVDLHRLVPKLLGTPKILTRAGYRGRYVAGEGIDVEALQAWYGQADKEWAWTSTACVALAAFLGATEITAFGADFIPGAPQFDGFEGHEPNLSKERFNREREAWNVLVRWLAGRGVDVKRPAPQAGGSTLECSAEPCIATRRMALPQTAAPGNALPGSGTKRNADNPTRHR